MLPPSSPTRTAPSFLAFVVLLGSAALTRSPVHAQEPVGWGGADLEFHTFSIVGVDPVTGEVGAAVTTRNACVGNGVPWVRVGVGAVATQASTRTQYGHELLDMIESGMDPAQALASALTRDDRAESRQVGVISADGRSAQHTGTRPGNWAGHRSGLNYATQGNVLMGPEVLDAVARTFEATEGSPWLGRLISARRYLKPSTHHIRTSVPKPLIFTERPAV